MPSLSLLTRYAKSDIIKTERMCRYDADVSDVRKKKMDSSAMKRQLPFIQQRTGIIMRRGVQICSALFSLHSKIVSLIPAGDHGKNAFFSDRGCV